MQTDLFDLLLKAPPLYPQAPGAKGIETSHEAAEAIQGRAATLRQAVLRSLSQTGPSTADEVADQLGESALSIRPRVAELHRMGFLADTGDRRYNASGRRAAIWEVV